MIEQPLLENIEPGRAGQAEAAAIGRAPRAMPPPGN